MKNKAVILAALFFIVVLFILVFNQRDSMKLYWLFICVLTWSGIFSQNVLFDPVSGKIFNPEKYSDISGSPFLFDKWINGSVSTPRGVYKNLQLKLDVYNNTIFFNKDDQAFEFQDQISGFILEPKSGDSLIYLKGLTGNGLRSEQFVQVLALGKTSFYKSEQRLFAEINQINKGIVKKFTTSVRYYININDKLQLIRLNKSELLGVLNDKLGLLEEFTRQNKIDYRREADVAKLIKHLNSL